MTTADRPGLGPWRSTSPPEGWQPFPDDALDRSLTDRLLEVAARFETNVALRSPAGAWTFERLRHDVLATASRISAAVDGATGVPIAVMAQHDGPLVVAVLATIAAGNVVVVVDPAAPPEQSVNVLDEAGPSLLLHDDTHASAARELAAACALPVPASPLGDVHEPASGEFSPPPRGPGDPAMLAFTSGTSGGSKAGVITHGGLLNLVRGATDALGIGPDDRMPMLFPISLAVASYPMFLPLLNGGTLSTLDVRSVGLNPVADFLAEERITLAYMAPTVVRFLVDALAGRSFPDLRMIALGGEPVDADVVRLTEELFDPQLVANGFGTTETGVITLYVMSPDATFEGTVPTGYAVPDVDLFVLDDHGDPVAPGESGEVAVASPYLFRGYWGHPELTASVLTTDPEDRDGWQLYRTGDLGRLDGDGALTVLGRLDTKVKIRGRFVVLGDVEADLHEMDEVGDAVVVAADGPSGTELVAAVTPAGDGTLDVTALRAALLERREAYRVPSRWEVVDELPRLPNGKLDRRAVLAVVDDPRAGGRSTHEGRAGDAAPRDLVARLQRELRDLWELLLPAPVVGLDDEFAHLGGDSLLAAQMLVMLEQRLGVTVPMSAMVDARTVRDLAEVVAEISSESPGPVSTAARVQTGSPDRPLLWFVHDLPGSAYRVRRVAEHLGADQPLWSFESPLIRGEPNAFTSLDTFAAQYVRDLRAVQPEGPYWLAGYSFGGICAYQMARQLTRDGEEVAFLGVVDVGPGYRGPNWTGRHSPPWPYFGVPRPPAAGSSPVAAARHYLAMLRSSPRATLRHLSLRTGTARRIDRVRFAADLRRHGRVRPEWRLWYAWEEHWKLATKAWDRSNRYDGPLHLFWAGETGSTDASMGWAPLVADLHVHRFPGFHDDLLEEQGAPALSRSLREVLDEVLRARG